MVKLTPGMDTSTIMVEGQPNLKINSVRERAYEDGKVHNQVYVHTAKWTRAYNQDGTRAPDVAVRGDPNIVSRNKVDVNLPIIATDQNDEVYKYRYFGQFVPADGSEPRLKLSRVGHDDYNFLEIYASTGKVCRGSYGSALTFSNGPVVVTKAESVLIGGVGVTLSVTRTNGEITAVSLP